VIELFEGLPGAGKSHEAIKERLLPIIRETQRRCRVRLNGIEHRTWSLLLGVREAELRSRLILLTGEDVHTLPVTSDVNDFILIDEAQSFWRAGDKVDPEILKWLETHRHKGQDVLVLVQRWDQLAQGITRLIELTTLYRKAMRFGLTKRFQGFVRGNPREKEIIRSFTGTYDPTIYALYASYVTHGIQEARVKGGSIWRSWFLIAASLFLILAAVLFWQSPGLERYAQNSKSASTPAKARTRQAPGLAPGAYHGGPGISGAESEAGVPMGTTPAPGDLVIVGGLGYADGTRWRFELADGRHVTLEELQGLAGRPTTWRQVAPGDWRLSGEGVRYGRPMGPDVNPADRASGLGLLSPGAGGGTDSPAPDPASERRGVGHQVNTVTR
jgi:zona occludens toxin (predicted ATPase)